MVVVSAVVGAIITRTFGVEMGIGDFVPLVGDALGFIGGQINAGNANALANEQMRIQQQNAFNNLDFQRQLSNFGIRWKVEDAQAAGIHPLFALGASTMNFSPTTVGATDIPRNDSNKYLANMGQDISRAIDATRTSSERTLAQHEAAHITQQAITRGDLQNELLAVQLASARARLQADQVGPPMPGGSPAGLSIRKDLTGRYELEPNKVTTASPTDASSAAGPPGPYANWFRSGSGLQSEPPKSSKAEDEFLAPIMTDWYWRNRIMPNFGSTDRAPPLSSVQASFPGATGVYWSHVNQMWMPSYLPGGRRPGWFESNERRVK